MRTATIFFLSLSFMTCIEAKAEDRITLSTELQRLRSGDHLFRPQSHRLVQYSGFHRKGGNPDRMDCLHTENGWRVVADHKGPGVVSRIWTTPGGPWGDIQVEVDNQTIFAGKAPDFFAQEKLPFQEPLSEIRQSSSGDITAEKEASGKKQWAVSYVPIPFAKRFRYLQRNPVYANINIKELPPGAEVESFLHVDSNALKNEFEKTAAVWKTMNLYGASLEKCECIRKTVEVPPSASDAEQTVELAQFEGPAIIRGIRVKAQNSPSRAAKVAFRSAKVAPIVGESAVTYEESQADEPADYSNVDLCISWDGQKTPSVRSPLALGFGSRNQRTLASGQSAEGWRFLHLPMPFKQKARLALASRSDKAAKLTWEIFVEKPARLPADVLYLHSHHNQGLFRAGQDKLGPQPRPIADFFYRVGYTALDFQGTGHVVAYMDLFQCQPELDEHVFIDGERIFPDNRWNGTGHEDLFDMAWGHKPLSAPMTSGGSQTFEEVNVKLFWNDPMTFRTEIRFNWEWCYRFGIEAPKDARFASVIYWYTEPELVRKK